MCSPVCPIRVSLLVFADSQVRLTTERGLEERFVRILSCEIVSHQPRHGRTIQEAVNSLVIGLKPEVPTVDSRRTIELETPSHTVDFVIPNRNVLSLEWKRAGEE